MRRPHDDPGIFDRRQQGKHELPRGIRLEPVTGSACIAVRERGFITVMPVGDKECPARESGRKVGVELGIGHSGQAMGSSHLIPIFQELPAAGVIGDRTSDLATSIPVQEIERTQVRLYRPQPIQALLSRTGRRPLVRQDNPLSPIGQAYPGQQPCPSDRGSPLVEPVTMNVDHRRSVSVEHTLLEPRPIAPRGQGVIVASGTEVNAFDVANAELCTVRRLCGNIVGGSDERTDRTSTKPIEADSA